MIRMAKKKKSKVLRKFKKYFLMHKQCFSPKLNIIFS